MKNVMLCFDNLWPCQNHGYLVHGDQYPLVPHHHHSMHLCYDHHHHVNHINNMF